MCLPLTRRSIIHHNHSHRDPYSKPIGEGTTLRPYHHDQELKTAIAIFTRNFEAGRGCMGILQSLFDRLTCTTPAQAQHITTEDISHPYVLALRPMPSSSSSPADPPAPAQPRHHHLDEFGSRPHSTTFPRLSLSRTPNDWLGSSGAASGSRVTGGRKLRKTRVVEGDWELVRRGEPPVPVELGSGLRREVEAVASDHGGVRNGGSEDRADSQVGLVWPSGESWLMLWFRTLARSFFRNRIVRHHVLGLTIGFLQD